MLAELLILGGTLWLLAVFVPMSESRPPPAYLPSSLQRTNAVSQSPTMRSNNTTTVRETKGRS